MWIYHNKTLNTSYVVCGQEVNNIPTFFRSIEAANEPGLSNFVTVVDFECLRFNTNRCLSLGLSAMKKLEIY